MSAQGGKSSGDSSTFSPYAPILAKMARERFGATMPTLNLLSSQTQEALRTGGVNAQIPIINRSVDAARQSLSSTTEQTRQALARAGLSNSSYATSLLGEQRMEGNQGISQVPSSIASQFISGAPQLGLDTGGQSGLAAAMAGNTSSNWSSQSMGGGIKFEDIVKILAAATGGAGGGAPP